MATLTVDEEVLSRYVKWLEQTNKELEFKLKETTKTLEETDRSWRECSKRLSDLEDQHKPKQVRGM